MEEVIKRDAEGFYYMAYIPDEEEVQENPESIPDEVETSPSPEPEEEQEDMKKNAFGLPMTPPKPKKPKVKKLTGTKTALPKPKFRKKVI